MMPNFSHEKGKLGHYPILLVLWVMFGSPLAKLGLYYLSFLPIIWIAMRQVIGRVSGGILLFNFGVVLSLRVFNADSIATVFFFSSRRRHTRFDCDWSSDVCSSDLRMPLVVWSLFITAILLLLALPVLTS